VPRGNDFKIPFGTHSKLLAGCGKTHRNCQSDPAAAGEESGPERFQDDTQSGILRCALQKLDALLVSIEQPRPSLTDPSSPRN
jgi:hypothetical protein